jgi:hypothetical protein
MPRKNVFYFFRCARSPKDGSFFQNEFRDKEPAGGFREQEGFPAPNITNFQSNPFPQKNPENPLTETNRFINIFIVINSLIHYRFEA